MWLIQRYDTVASTMDQAAALAQCGARERTVVVSDEQTRGRGRGGRTWQAPPGSALFCTIILRPDVAPPRLSALPLIAGVAVAEAIEAAVGCDVALKWPNDVWLGTDPERRKVAGILLASNLRGSNVAYVLIGIGVNIAGGVGVLPAGATSIVQATSVFVSPDALLKLLLERFDHHYGEYLASAGQPPLAAWRNRAAFLGDRVAIEEVGHTLQGLFVDIDDDGALLLQQDDGRLRRVVAGDLARGPRPMPQPG